MPMSPDGAVAVAVTGGVDNAGEPTRFRYKRELEMQVRFRSDKAPWHRLTIDSARGFEHGANRENIRIRCTLESIGDNYYATREESYEGNLCLNGCFGPGEIRLAAEQRRQQSSERRADLEDAEREFLQRESQRAEQLRQDKERVRLATERMQRIERETAEREAAEREAKKKNKKDDDK